MVQTATCLDNMSQSCQTIGFNKYEEQDMMLYPQIDVFPLVERGNISPDWNAGLRMPQAKQITVDMYNSGCTAPWGCVSNTGFRCNSGAKHSEIGKFYDFLQAPFMAGVYKGDLEYEPPEFMAGIKTGTFNSVNGWNAASGPPKKDVEYVWQQTGIARRAPGALERQQCE
jgi:hypothetical protein